MLRGAPTASTSSVVRNPLSAMTVTGLEEGIQSRIYCQAFVRHPARYKALTKDTNPLGVMLSKLCLTLDVLATPQTKKTYQRIAGHWAFYFSLYRLHYHVQKPMFTAAITGQAVDPRWTTLFLRIWQELPHVMPWATSEPLRTAAADASNAGLVICLKQGNIAFVVPHPQGIYLRELTAVCLAALVGPLDTVIFNDNEALVQALRFGHGRAFQPMYSLALTLLSIKKWLWYHWLPTDLNPADAPSQITTAHIPVVR